MAGNFEITVVVKIAGNGKMLKRTMESLENQTLGFKDNIQVIFLKGCELEAADMGICQDYLKKYPDNVIMQTDLDIQKIAGRYVNYMQEGQYWNEDALKRVVQLYTNAAGELPLLTEMFRDSGKGVEPQEYYEFAVNYAEKFQDEAGKYFFSRMFLEKLQQLIVSESRLDKAVLLAEILLETWEMGILETIKLYGKKTQYSTKTKDWYLQEMPQFRQKMQELLAKKGVAYKGILDAMLLYQMIESFKEKVDESLTEEDLQQYEQWVGQTLQNMDDLVISKAPGMNSPLRIYAFSLKAGKDIREELQYCGGRLLYHNLLIYDMNGNNEYKIVRKTIINDEIQMIIQVYYPMSEEKIQFYLSNGREKRQFSYVEKGEKEYQCLNHVLMQEKEYSCTIPLVHARNGKKCRVVSGEIGTYALSYQCDGIYENDAEHFDVVEI